MFGHLNPRSAPWIGLLTLLLTCFAAGPANAERKLSLDQAIQLALKQNSELKLEQAKVDEAEANRKSMRGLYGPKLMVEGNVMVWNEALAFSLESPSLEELINKIPEDQRLAAIGTLTKYTDLMGVLPYLFDLGNIREQVTASASVTLAQPLTPLLQIHNGYKATRSMAEATRLDKQSKQAEVAFKISQTYLQLMQAQRFTEVAQTGVKQVEAHLRQAEHFHTAGLIGKQAVLKARLELARAKERVIKARYGASLAGSALAMMMGLSVNEVIVPTEKVADPPPPMSQSLQAVSSSAVKNRSELASLRKKQTAAKAGKNSAMWDMIPSVNAVASYQYTYGQGTFMPENAFFVGAMLKWDVWDWGHKYYKMKAASMKARQAELGQRLLRDGVQIQAKKAFLDLKQSDEALAVARVAIKEAEENFRIETQRFEANANTSTDVLDAQLALTRSQLSYTTSLYGHYIAYRALLRAMGRLK